MKRFSIVENGYDIDEVNRFIDIVIGRLEKLNPRWWWCRFLFLWSHAPDVARSFREYRIEELQHRLC